jgi:hypothetical protein
MWVLVMRILGIDFSLNIREDVDVEENFRRCSAARARMLMCGQVFSCFLPS